MAACASAAGSKAHDQRQGPSLGACESPFGRGRGCYRPAIVLARSLLVVTVAATIGVNGAAATAPSSPCKLATAAEVKAAFGGTVGAGRVDTSIAGAPTCKYTIRGSNLGLSGSAIVFVSPGQSAKTFALARKEVPGAVSVRGVGNAAFYNPHTTSVELLKGNTVASAQAVFLNPGGRQPNAAKIKADVIALAKAVAKHL